MNNVLVISLFSFLFVVCHLVVLRNPVAPGVVQGLIWLLVSLAYFLFLGDVNALSANTLIVVTAGISSFSAGALAGTRLPDLKSVRIGSKVINTNIPKLIVLVSAIGVVMMFHKALEYAPINEPISLVQDVGRWFKRLRYSLVVDHNGSFGLAGYILNFAFAGTAYLVLYARRTRPTVWLWFSIVLSLGFAILYTGKTHLLLFFCLALSVAVTGTKFNRLAFAFWASCFVVIFLIFTTWLSGRLQTTSFDEALVTLVHHYARGYLIIPLGALDILVNSDLPSSGGSLTFRTPLAVLRFLGAPVSVPDLLLPAVTFASDSVNVYTVVSPYYRDFGVLGVCGFMASLGSLHGWVFNQLKTGMLIIMVGNGILYYALLMQAMQDQYFSLMSQWIQILGWSYLLNWLDPIPTSHSPLANAEETHTNSNS